VSTDVLVPTVVDSTSLETVVGFAHTVRKFKHAYNYRLEILGVIPSLTFKGALTDIEKGMLTKLDHRLAGEGFSFKVLPVNVPRRATGEILAGARQLYLADEKCREVFDEIVLSLNLPPPSDAIRGTYENSGVSVSA
jgi:hypothetical protein